MEKMATIKAKNLAPATRAWLAQILHVDLTEADEVTMTLHRPIHAPTPEQRMAARQDLLQVLHRLDEKTEHAPDEEMDAAIDDAFRHLRPPHDECA